MNLEAFLPEPAEPLDNSARTNTTINKEETDSQEKINTTERNKHTSDYQKTEIQSRQDEKVLEKVQQTKTLPDNGDDKVVGIKTC